MASRHMHPTGKPAGLRPADLPPLAEPVAYLTKVLQGLSGPVSISAEMTTGRLRGTRQLSHAAGVSHASSKPSR
jgi:hypothetical protein